MEVIPLGMEMVMVVDVGSPHRPVVVDLLVCLEVVGMETTETMETVGVVEDLGGETVEVVLLMEGTGAVTQMTFSMMMMMMKGSFEG